MRRLVALAASLLLFGSVPYSATAEEWSMFRGPHNDGAANIENVPAEWSLEKGLFWQAELPGPGNGSPVIWKDRVFVTAAANEGKQRWLNCYDLAKGAELWSAKVEYAGVETTHETSPNAPTTPATDGEIVVVFHGSAGLIAYDLDGKEIWKRDLGKLEHIWGFGGSPILFGDLVLLTTGPGTRAFLIAVDKTSGETRWEKSYPAMISKKADEFRGAWSTPVVIEEVDGEQKRSLALFSLPGMLVALDPRTGDEVWRCEGLTELQYTSPVVGDDLIVAMSGYGGSALAVERGGQGDVTEAKRLWLHTDRKEIPQRIGSGVIVDGYLYVINEPGILWCMNPRTGEKLWEERLGRNSWSSLCYVDGRLYSVDWAGTTFVIEPHPEKLVLLSKNPTDGMTRATLAFAPGKVVQRTWEKLYCFGEAAKPK